MVIYTRARPGYAGQEVFKMRLYDNEERQKEIAAYAKQIFFQVH